MCYLIKRYIYPFIKTKNSEINFRTILETKIVSHINLLAVNFAFILMGRTSEDIIFIKHSFSLECNEATIQILPKICPTTISYTYIKDYVLCPYS